MGRSAINAAANDDANLEASAELYAVYQPRKMKDRLPHPDPIVETTTLARTDPPDATYRHHLHDAVAQGWGAVQVKNPV